MPSGRMIWFDRRAGDGMLEHLGHLYAVRWEDVEPRARTAGARVHFDRIREGGAVRAVNVRLTPGRRSTRRQHRFGDLVGAHRPDEKGRPIGVHPTQHGRRLEEQPTEVVHRWITAVGAGDVAAAAALYAPDATLHDDDRHCRGLPAVRLWLERSPLVGGGARGADVRFLDDRAVVTWPPTPPAQGACIELSLAHGRIQEQWSGASAARGREGLAASTAGPDGAIPVQVSVTHGTVSETTKQRAQAKIAHVALESIEPVLLATVTLSEEGNPSIERAAIAKATLDVNGTIVRGHVAAPAMTEAIDLLEEKLRHRLESLRRQLLSRRGDTGDSGPGEWRHGDLAWDRPAYFPRPPEERELVRHKTFQLHRATPDETAFDMHLLDYDWMLFTDAATGSDAVLERLEDGYRLTLASDAATPTHATAIALVEVAAGVTRMRVDQAVELMNVASRPFVFFVAADTGRGSVVYRRYDGHYGLVTPAARPSASGTQLDRRPVRRPQRRGEGEGDHRAHRGQFR